jgi:hypothetical protein
MWDKSVPAWFAGPSFRQNAAVPGAARPYPFDQLPRLTRADAAVQSALARWLAARPSRDGLAALAGGPVRVRFAARGGSPGTVIGRAPGIVAQGAPTIASGPIARARVPDAARSDAPESGGAGAMARVAPEIVAVEREPFDPFAARCEVRVGGASIEVLGSSRAVRALAQRLLGGPAELAAPRPLTHVEQSLWALVVATALEDLAIAGEVIPRVSVEPAPVLDRPVTISLDVMLGELAIAVELHAPALDLRVPPPRPLPAWADRTMIDCPIVVGRCALPEDAVRRLAVRDIVTLERPLAGHPEAGGRGADAGLAVHPGGRGADTGLAVRPGGRGPDAAPAIPHGCGPDAELVIFGGAVGLRAAPNAVSAEACTGYVPRDMSLPDDAHVELTVALGTTQLSLRQVVELAVGQIIQLGRPLAGPFELRAAGRTIGRGELVDVDGELGVRIVSLES